MELLIDVNLKGAFLFIREAIKKMTYGDKNTRKKTYSISIYHQSMNPFHNRNQYPTLPQKEAWKC